MNILSVDGGGYLGLATAKFIAESERHFGQSFHHNFELFCGTSTGAIIALALACGKSGDEIVALYEKLGSEVFNNRIPLSRAVRFCRWLLVSKYSNKNLRKALADTFGNTKLGDLKSNGKKVLITAFSVTNGKPRVFKTDHSPSLSLDDQLFVRDVALASSAAPTFLPNIRLSMPTGTEEVFCDGGVFSNHPAILGYAEAVSHLDVLPTKIRLLSLSTPRKDISEKPSKIWRHERILSRGVSLWATKLSSIFIDSNSEISHQALRRIMAWQPETASNYCRIDLQSCPGLDLDVTNKKATETLKHIGLEKAKNNETRKSLEFFLQNKI